jgi:2-polyprenyl-3-methyl-5-hydroxy-6-metoxy-1,4-benzoquinol methylase
MTKANPLINDQEVFPGVEIIEISDLLAASGEPALDYTGERMVPEVNRGHLVYAEHLLRYLFAAQFAAGKTVLDFGSGEGYGASIISSHGASSVTGMDISPVAVDHARAKYQGENLSYVCGDCLEAPFQGTGFDLITSFEVMEHLNDHRCYLREVCRLLKDDGLFIVSTPNIATSVGANPFHLKELTFSEFKTLLSDCFKNMAIFAQTNLMSSVIYGLDAATAGTFRCTPAELLPAPDDCIYFIAVCSNGDIPAASNYNLLSGNQEYIDLRDNIRHLSGIIHDQNASIEGSKSALADKSAETEKLRDMVDILMKEREETAPVIGRYRDLVPRIVDIINFLERDSVSVGTLLSAAHLCMALDISGSARRFFHRVLKLEPGNVPALYQMGKLYFDEGKYSIAGEYCKKALCHDPGHGDALALHARLGSGVS